MAKVQDLRDDVGGLEENLHPREALGQLGAKALDVAVGGVVIFIQGNLDFAVQGANHARIAVRQVQAAVRHAQVVQHGADLVGGNGFTDGGFNAIGQAGGFLNAGARGGAKVQADQAGVHGGEKVAAQNGVQTTGGQAKRQEARNEAPAPWQQGAQDDHIATAHALKTSVKSKVDAFEK